MSNLLMPLSVEACRRRKEYHLEKALHHLSKAEEWEEAEKAALEERIREELVAK